jgi:protein-disulfide isomerase
MTNNESMSTKRQPNAMGVPFAIVIAGALIAGALYFGTNSPSTETAIEPQVVKNDVAAKPAAAPAQPAVGEIRAVTSEDHILGAKNAKVTVIEYSDFECPFCKSFHPTMQKLVKEYPNDVRWVYRQFPLESLHSKAKKEAEATECAAEQGKFWEMTDKIFETTPSNDGLVLADLPKLAQAAGVANIKQFESCLESGKFTAKVEADISDAQAAGGRGTPYSVVITASGEKLPLSGAQPYASVKKLVDQALGS